MVINQPGSNSQSDRANHLDWLRLLIVFMLIPYHTAMMFLVGHPLGWINNSVSSSAATAFVQILDQFQMPLLFAIAGIAAWFSLGNRTMKQYFVERLGRLFVPLIFGALIVNVPIYYISVLYYHRGLLYNNSYFIWYKTYLSTMLFPWQRNWTPETLWFIWYLFIYSIAVLPLFIFLRKHVGNFKWIKFGEFFEKHGMSLLFLSAILPVLVQFYPPPNFHSVFQISYFIFFFIYGFILYSSKQIQHYIDRFGHWALIIGAVSILVVILLIIPDQTNAPLGSVYWPALGTLGQYLYMILRGISCWFSIIGLIFLARKWAGFSNRFLRYANEIVLPFYLLHAVFDIAVGYYVIPLHIGVLAKFAIICVSTLVATLATIEIFKRFRVTRFLLGMRIKKRENQLP